MYDKLNIVIPVFNEGDNIIKTINEIQQKIEIPNEIHIVYDFDEDNTLPPLKKFIHPKLRNRK